MQTWIISCKGNDWFHFYEYKSMLLLLPICHIYIVMLEALE